MRAKRFLLPALVLLLSMSLGIFSQAGVPQLISFQGFLKDNLGNPLDGTFSIQFSIYNAQTGGSLIWSEARSVNVDSGAFSIYLGEVTELTESAFSDSGRYLGVTVESDPEMSRTRMTTSPYAYRIATVDGSISQKLVLDDSNNTRVELGVGSNILRVYDEDGWLRVRLSIDSTPAKDGRGLDGGGAISFFPAGVAKRGEEHKLYDGSVAGGGLIRLGESEQGAGEINVYDTAGNEIARMTSTDKDAGAYYTYWTDGTVLTLQGQSADTGGYVANHGTNGNRSAALTSIVGLPGHGAVGTFDTLGNTRAGMFTDGGADGHFFLYNHFGTTTVEMSNYGNETESEGGFVHVRGPNGNLNAAMWFLNGWPNNGFIDVFDSLGQNQAGMYVDTAGNGVIFADQKNFRIDNPNDPETEIWYASLEGPEAGTYFRGTAKLESGRAVVQFPEHFTVVASPVGMTVQVVPLSAKSLGMAVTEKTAEYIVVEELNNGTGSYSFDFTVSAVRKGYEDYKVIRSKQQGPSLDKSLKGKPVELVGPRTPVNESNR